MQVFNTPYFILWCLSFIALCIPKTGFMAVMLNLIPFGSSQFISVCLCCEVFICSDFISYHYRFNYLFCIFWLCFFIFFNKITLVNRTLFAVGAEIRGWCRYFLWHQLSLFLGFEADLRLELFKTLDVPAEWSDELQQAELVIRAVNSSGGTSCELHAAYKTVRRVFAELRFTAAHSARYYQLASSSMAAQVLCSKAL